MIEFSLRNGKTPKSYNDFSPGELFEPLKEPGTIYAKMYDGAVCLGEKTNRDVPTVWSRIELSGDNRFLQCFPVHGEVVITLGDEP